MLTIWRRHEQYCPHQHKGRDYQKCRCPLWMDWRVSGKRIRRALGIRDWQVAQQRAREMEAAGLTSGGAPVTIEDALGKFIADATARGLRTATLRKYDLLKRNLTAFCQDRGLVFLRQLDLDKVRDFRNSWKLSARTAVKTLERLRSFLKFCVESEWLDNNPAVAIKPGKVEDAEVLPFSQPEVDKILKACDSFNGNGDRIRALANLMLATGLRIGDATTISRERSVQESDGWKVVLRTAKSGTTISVPVQGSVVKEIQSLPGEHPFWSGQSNSDNCSSVWEEAFRKLFKQAGVKVHPHQFRHTFAKNLLIAEVPLETVSVLLGHRKLAITEKHYARFVPERQAAIDHQVRKSWARGGHARKTPQK
jgi:integrase/recombinase XerD